MLVDDERRVFRDVAGYFAGALLVYKRAEATYVNVVALSHRVLHYFEEGFYGRQHIGFFDAGFLRNFGNYLSFGHVGKGVLEVKKNDLSDGLASDFRRKPLPGKGLPLETEPQRYFFFFLPPMADLKIDRCQNILPHSLACSYRSGGCFASPVVPSLGFAKLVSAPSPRLALAPYPQSLCYMAI